MCSAADTSVEVEGLMLSLLGHDCEGRLWRSGEGSGQEFKAVGAGQSGVEASVEESEAGCSDGDAIGSGTAFDDGEGADGKVFAE